MRQAGLFLALFAVLTGCGLFNKPETPVEFFRDLDIPLTSTTRFDAGEFFGFWNVRAKFAHEDAVPGRSGVEFQPGPDGDIVQIVMHAMKRGRLKEEASFEVEQVMPGRLVYGELPFATEYWVLWVDEDYRTAAIGTPSGTFGWIIDRERSGGEDRIVAAREVLEWLGYDMNRLIELP